VIALAKFDQVYQARFIGPQRCPDESAGRQVAVKGVLSQSCIFDAKSENHVSKNQWLASPNFPVSGNLRQNSHAPWEHHDTRKSNLQGNRSTRLHGLWNQTGSFRRGLGSTHRLHLLLVVQVGSRLGLVHHVSLCQRPTPTGELQRDPVWVLKVDGPEKG
jgi:hypothetical protein